MALTTNAAEIIPFPRAKPKRKPSSRKGTGRVYERGGVFYLDYYSRTTGARIRRRCSPSREVALLALREITRTDERAAAGLDPEIRDTTVEDWLTEWKETRKATMRPRTYIANDRPKADLFLAWAKKRGLGLLSQIRPAALEEFKADRMKAVSRATVAADFRVLGKCLQDAVKAGHIATNPVRLVAKVKVPEREKRALDPAEVKLLLDAAKGDPLFPFIAAAVYAGLRLEELLNLEWSDVNFEAGLIVVKNKPPKFITKSYRLRRVPLAPALADILRKVRGAEGPCFPSTTGTFRDGRNTARAFREIVDRSKLKDKATVGIHTLRHTFVTNALLAGVAPVVVQRCAGHKDLVTTLGYSHVQEKDLIAGMKAAWRKA